MISSLSRNVSSLTRLSPEPDLEGGVRGVRPPPPKIRKAYVMQR